jgi:hypothetical protein
MPVSSYSDRQIEVANLLHSLTKDGETVPSDVADEILNIVGSAEVDATIPVLAAQAKDTEIAIRIKIMEEDDWRKKAALCALLISRSLD